MSGCNASQGYKGQLALDLGDDATVDWATSSLMEIQSETIEKRYEKINTAGLRGTRARELSRTIDGSYTVGGRITLQPSPRDLAIILPMCGFQLTTGTYNLTENLALFGVFVDRIAETYEYQNCYCNSLTIRGESQQILTLELELSGDEEVTGGTYPTLSFPTGIASNPLAMWDSTITIGGTAYPVNSFELRIQHILDVKHRNSRQPQSICATDRIITLRTNHPFTSSETALQGLTSSAAASIALVNGTVGATFSFANLVKPDRTPTIPGRSEILLDAPWMALRSGATLEMTATVDETP